MGMYDSIYCTCPYCNKDTELQSKSGECALDSYRLNNVPYDVGKGIIHPNGWTLCNNCKKDIVIFLNHHLQFEILKL